MSRARHLELIFQRCFETRLRTQLRGGASEPLYRPACGRDGMHVVFYRHDYDASALHEVAHWCIAGARRRLLVDYGYWYAPDGRSSEQQLAFERVEAKPQALESIFADAWGIGFELSADNLMGDAKPSDSFAHAVTAQRERYLAHGLPERAAIFRDALARATERQTA